MDPNAATALILASASAAAAIRLVYTGLARRFPALLGYLSFQAAINIGLALLNPVSGLYFWVYLSVEPLKCVVSIMAVQELFSLTFDNYPGIRTVGRWVMYGGVGLALSASLLLTGLFWRRAAEGRAHSILFYLHVSQRSVVFTLAFVIVANLLFLSRYPLHLGRNTIVSSAFFSILFLSEASRLLVDTLSPHLFNLYVDWSQAIFVSICLFSWAAMLQPEAQTVQTRVKFATPQEEHLLEQLNSLNQLMARAAKR